MTITANKEDVLKTLRANRDEHADVVKEAREGYVKRAEKALANRLAAVKEGKLVSLAFNLKPPLDHTKEYDLAINMLELHLGDEIELTAMQVQNFIRDEWGWKQRWSSSNSMYSDKAAAIAADYDPPEGF